MTVLPGRAELLALSPNHGDAVGAEIGVYIGGNAGLMLKQCDPYRLWLVDCWQEQPWGIYSDHANVKQSEQDERYRTVVKLFEDDNRVRIVRAFSEEAAKLFKPGELDFVHLDANHGLAAIQSDLRRWWPILKSGGFFSGHDYCDPEKSTFPCFVKPAVDAFLAEMDLSVQYTTNEPGHPYQSWGVFKP